MKAAPNICRHTNGTSASMRVSQSRKSCASERGCSERGVNLTAEEENCFALAQMKS